MDVVKRDPEREVAGDLQIFCGEVTLHMARLETRLREMAAASERPTERVLLEEAIGWWLQVAKSLLDTRHHAHQSRLLGLRPLLRTLSENHS